MSAVNFGRGLNVKPIEQGVLEKIINFFGIEILETIGMPEGVDIHQLYFIDTDELNDGASARTDESFLFAKDNNLELFGEIKDQYSSINPYVGPRYIGNQTGGKRIPDRQLFFNIFNSTAAYNYVVEKKGKLAALFLYASFLSQPDGVYEDFDPTEYFNDKLVGRMQVVNFGRDPANTSVRNQPVGKIIFDKKIKDARDVEVKKKMISDVFRGEIENWFAEINWNNPPRDVPNAHKTKYPKVALLAYETWLKSEDNWNGVITDKIIEILSGNVINTIDGIRMGQALLDRIDTLEAVQENPTDPPSLITGAPVEETAVNFINALISPNYETNINILDILGFQESDAVQNLPEGADTDEDGVVDAGELVEALQGAGQDFLEQASALIRGIGGGEEATEQETRVANQCALMSGLLYGDHPWDKYWLMSYNQDNTVNIVADENSDPEKRISPLGKPEGYRIYPVDPNSKIDARSFMNFCEMDKDVNKKMQLLAEDQVATIKEHDKMHKELWWVFEDKGVLKETKLKLTDDPSQGLGDYAKYESALEIYYSNFDNPIARTQRLRDLLPGEKIDEQSLLDALFAATPDLDNASDFFHLNDIKINFKGGNPATAKSDVTVDMSFTLSSLQALTNITINEDKTPFEDKNKTLDIKLYNLITLPNFGTIQEGIGSNLKNQYHPDYSRVRLKVFPELEKERAIILDLTTIDHTIDRAGKKGSVQMTISMRGYFENLSNVPEHDILTTPEGRAQRLELKRLIDKQLEQKCPRDEIKETEKKKKEVYGSTKRSYASILKRLSKLNCIHNYTYQSSKVANIIRGTTSISESYLNLITYGANYSHPRGNAFFFLGDLIYVMLDALYVPDSIDYLPTAKKLNTRLVVGAVQVPLLNGTEDTKSFSPLSMPIDLQYFMQWYDLNIISKGIESMTIGLFLKELLEKFANDILIETCFSGNTYASSFPSPEITLTNRFTTEKKWFVKNKQQFLNPLRPYNGRTDVNTLFPKKAYFDGTGAKTREVVGHNYLLIYPRYQLPIKSITERNTDNNNQMLKNTPYCPTIFYGRNNLLYNFTTDIRLSKQNKPGLRESRLFSNDFGNLSLLAGVYDLSFSFIDRAANTIFYPGVQLNFVLLDWDSPGLNTKSPYLILKDDNGNNNWSKFGQNNPHDPYTLANITGLGGYFTVVDVSYSIGLDPQDFTITVSAKYCGSDATTELRERNMSMAAIDEEGVCESDVANGEKITEPPPADKNTTETDDVETGGDDGGEKIDATKINQAPGRNKGGLTGRQKTAVIENLKPLNDEIITGSGYTKVEGGSRKTPSAAVAREFKSAQFTPKQSFIIKQAGTRANPGDKFFKYTYTIENGDPKLVGVQVQKKQ